MSVYRQDSPPDSGSVGDRWVDTDDENKIYVCTTAYAENTVPREFTIPGTERPGGEALKFESTVPSTFEIVSGGANGPPTMIQSGAGTSASPYHYIITLFDDRNSNKEISDLAVAQPSLTVTGDDDTDALLVDVVALTALDWAIYDFWSLRNIYALFVATPSQVTILDTSFSGYIPPAIQNILPEMVALRLAAMDGGGDLRRAGIWQNRIAQAKRVASMGSNSNPNTVATKRYF